MTAREIAERLNVSRTTVRVIIDQGGVMPEVLRAGKIQIDRALLEKLHDECEGFKQRIHERLKEEEKIDVPYSTLTRMIRQLGIGLEPKTRCDRVPDDPGKEMQHDTTVHTKKLAGRPTRLVASLLYLRYSKRRYLRFYRHFNRFIMKCFFHEALTFWEYAAGRCIIDNTNLARLRGTGENAIIVPEMAAFAKRYGFVFVCHRVKHPNRKAGEERSFRFVETSFFPGRTFESLEDINRQAFEWSTTRLDNRPMKKTGLVPAEAFEQERIHLKRVSRHIPEPYRVHNRGTDQYGYVAFDGNYYWVPGTDRPDVRVLEYSNRLKIYLRGELLAEYALPADGVRNALFSPKGLPLPSYQPRNRRKPTAEEEKRLRAMGHGVAAYLDFALESGGIQRHRFVRRLFRLSQEMTSELFVQTLQRAQKYRITDMETVRRVAYTLLNESRVVLPTAEVDESVWERESYQEGYLSDQPDFSPYDKLLEDDDGI